MTIEPLAFKPIQDVPGGPVPLHSPLYVSRPQIECKAFSEIAKPSGLLRLRAPQKMGKSTLIVRLLDYSLSLNYQPLYLDLQLADRMVLADPDRFLRWFCVYISRQLRLEPQIEQYWDNQVNSKVNCLVYFQTYLLQKIQQPIVLCLNEVNRIFDYPALVQEFLPLIRTMHEAGRHSQELQRLRFVLAYSTEIYVPLKLHQSPFNIGLLLDLPEFTISEIQQLADRYGFNWISLPNPQPAYELHNLTGGHPYLIQLALHHLSTQASRCHKSEVAFSHFLKTASMFSGIYAEHFQRHLTVLHTYPDLAEALRRVVIQRETSLAPALAHKLQSLGLIKLQGSQFVIGCQLYQRFFSQCLA